MLIYIVGHIVSVCYNVEGDSAEQAIWPNLETGRLIKRQQYSWFLNWSADPELNKTHSLRQQDTDDPESHNEPGYVGITDPKSIN